MHAREHDLDPALLAAVIYQESKFDPRAKSSSGAIGLMQLTPSTAHGIADPHRRQRVPHERPLRRRDQHPLRRVVPAQPLRQVRQRAARARRLQRGPGERRPLACERPADPVRRDARVREARRAPEVRSTGGRGGRSWGFASDATCRRSSSPRTRTRTRRSARRTSASSTTATCSGWAAATSRAGTSRSAFGSRADEVDEVRGRDPRPSAQTRAGRRARGRSGRTRRPATSSTGCSRSGSSTTSRRPLGDRHGAHRAAGAGAAGASRCAARETDARPPRGRADRGDRVRRPGADRGAAADGRPGQRRLPRVRRRRARRPRARRRSRSTA